MYVYRTSQFTQKAGRYGINTQLDKFCAELETQNLDEVQAHFKRVYPYLKRKADNNLRLIGRIVAVDDSLVLCLLDIFKRGDKDYEHFLLNPQEYGRIYLDSQLQDEELHRWLEGRKEAENNVPNPRSFLPDELRPWLEPPGWEMGIDNGAIVYESEEWLTRFNTPEIQKDFEIYNRIISALIDKPSSGEKITEWQGVNLFGEETWYILFSLVETSDIPSRKVLFLLAPFKHRPSTLEIAEIGQKTNLFDGYNNIFSKQLNLDKLTPFARRSYPDYLLADDQGWLALEGDEETNLALSAEEEAILTSVSTPALGNNSLPIFLNGQAGSGKSTMLSYLFADYCYRKYYNEKGQRRSLPLDGKLLFITYNERLLEVVKQTVHQLLSSHHQFLARRTGEDYIPDINNFFQPFQRFLLNLLPKEERDRFDLEQHISFHRFKQHYGESRLRKTYSPEFCWYVIRTFIKGYSIKKYMEPEEYQDLPRRERIISNEKFQEIYEVIWERWYKRITTESSYWDDQDLIRKVLDLNCYRPEYAAVFCDEAQDFTRLELQLIVRLSIFSQYDLGNQPILSLPFAFAGDPFQTLNPTGFRWESVKTVFYNEAIAALDPAGELRLGMNFQELERNYRSSGAIVQVNNLIQLWRHVLFNIPELKPQTAWQQGNFSEPRKFILGDNIFPEELRSYIRDTIIIVPCEEGEEVAYAQTDEVLSKILSSATLEEPPKNVLSAMTAKGLEFKRVILYKFGEACNRAVWQFINKDENPTVEMEYFFNKLYVAASRATERLFVVDSEIGDRQLWRYASNESQLQEFLRRSTKPAQWQERVQIISMGTAEAAQEMHEDDPISTAQELKIKGLEEKKSNLLRRAKQYYSDAGDDTEATICEAWALKFEERFRDAGDRFNALGLVDEAWECFWQGMCWLELVAWYQQHPDNKQARPLVNFMATEPQNLDAIKTFTQFLTDCKQLENNRYSKQWKTALEEYANRIRALISGHNLDAQEWQQFGEVLETLAKAGYNEMQYYAGECFFRAKKYESAVLSWENSNNTRKREYYLAKAQVVGLPDSLEYLEKAGEGVNEAGIITAWKKAGKPRAPRWLQYVAAAYEKNNEYHNACIAYIWLDNPTKVKSGFEKVSQGVDKTKLLKILIQYFIRQQRWSDAIEALENYLTSVDFNEKERIRLACELIYEVALSKITPADIIKEERDRYERFIKTKILSISSWHHYLFMQQMGVALERIGLIVQTLRFYEGFLGNRNQDIRKFAQERWIATKRKQEDYFRNQGNSDKAEKSFLEIAQNARKWRINVESVSIEPPEVMKERPSSEILLPSSKWNTLSGSKVVIKGLATAKVERIEPGVVRFQIRHLVIKMSEATSEVLITDALTNRELRVDLKQYKIYIGEVCVEASGSNKLSFQVPASGYDGAVFYDAGKYRLELNIFGLSGRISVEILERP